ncbi:MAG: SPOR domain-containing protein [Bacteroidales bacterium]|nr:SPOR domain-containing protein [Bacteroidales bacterium]
MIFKQAYSRLRLTRPIYFTLTRYLFFFVFLISLIQPIQVSAQEETVYDEISVLLEVPLIGGGEIAAVIAGEELYLPVTDLFDFLKIKNVPSPGLDSISGFFINPKATFIINRPDNRITYQDKTYNLEPGDLVRTESNLYLRSFYFGKIFGLECSFKFRSLSVVVNSKLELPLIREMRQEEMRKNLTRLKGEVKADTTVGRTYPGFKFGMADWSVYQTEEIRGKSDTRLNLALGSMIAGGEATASINYESTLPFSEKQQQYLWRYVNNDFQPLKQIMAGKITTNAISSIYNPVVGVKLTNTPTTYRRSFGSYTLSDRTDPGWIVELYVNNVLVDYVKADASGFFTFQIPLVYGNSNVILKYIGPWGEERTREQNINIPFNFLPVETFEYTVSAGIVEDTLKSRFSRASLNYGLTRSITVGGGAEYLSSVTSGNTMPYLNSSLRITNNILLSGEYVFGVRAKSTLTYRLPSNLQFDLNYTWYDKDQTAINYNYREERKATMSMPLRIGKFSSYQRVSLYQIILPSSQYTTGEWLFSGSLFKVNTNLTTYALFIDHTKPYLYSYLSLSYRLPDGLVLMPQVQYGYTKKEFISTKLAIEKHFIKNAYLNLSFEKNFSLNMTSAEVGFRYDFPFAQTGFSARQSNKKTVLVQYARGSLINDRQTSYLGADNRTNVGKGGISVIPFIDFNSNGKRDQGEPKAYGLNLRANGGRVEISDRDTTIRILGLEPYTSCFIELDPNSFENISWKLTKKTICVTVDPNILKLIEIPITVAGEATGMINLDKNGNKEGIGRIIVTFYDSNHRLAGKTLTEDDGYYSYLGLAPGNYLVRVDTIQLRKLRMISEPEYLEFNIATGIDGDVADGLDFILRPEQKDTATSVHILPQQPVVKKDTTYLIVHEVTQELVTIGEDSYAIQLGAFRNKSNAETLRQKLQKLLGKKVDIIIEDNFYKVRINDIKDRNEADNYIDKLHKNGVNEIWVISLKAKKQQWQLTEKQDTVTRITENVTETSAAISPEMLIQLGAFQIKSNALALKDRASAELDKKVIIVKEDGYYKVRIAGIPIIDQTVLEEMKKLEPSTGLGLKDMWVLPVIPKPVEEPAVLQPEIPQPEKQPAILQRETPPMAVEWKKEIPAILKPGISHRPVESKIVKSVIPHEPTISLQVGVFHKHSDALRAQRRIIAKLNLPVVIVQRWDYYHVLVTGFYTREETYQYYPELAGLGYPVSLLIEK